MESIQYIERTHEYYRKQGYEQTYRYAYNQTVPFTLLEKRLSQCRVALVTTAQFVMLDEQGAAIEPTRFLGTNELEVFTIPSDWPTARIRSTSQDHDRYQTNMHDVNAFFPLDRLHELVREGVIGSLSQSCYRTLPNYSQRKTTEVDAPEILRLCRQDSVDAALLTPV